MVMAMVRMRGEVEDEKERLETIENKMEVNDNYRRRRCFSSIVCWGKAILASGKIHGGKFGMPILAANSFSARFLQHQLILTLIREIQCGSGSRSGDNFRLDYNIFLFLPAQVLVSLWKGLQELSIFCRGRSRGGAMWLRHSDMASSIPK